MPDIAYAINDDGDITFPATGHVYRVQPSPRGRPAVTLRSDGTILHTDRFDLASAKERERFAAGCNGAGESIVHELLIIAQLLDEASSSSTKPPTAAPAIPYRATPGGLVLLRQRDHGEVEIPLCNFTAAIISQVAKDDGVERERVLEIEARLGDHSVCCEVSVNQFAAMNWPIEHLGANATVFAGSGQRDHVRAAVQLLSDQVPERTVYTHLGWCETPEGPVYLHAGGALGATGSVATIDVRLDPALAKFVLPPPPEGDDLVAAVRASVGIVGLSPGDGVASDEITFPISCAIWRSVVGETDVSVHEVGPTGQGKTETVALAQQHWGAELDARHLPGTWSSTGNALEGLASAAKDALLVIDDFVPAGTVHDQARHHREAERVFRAQGNRAGRGRMRPDGSLRPPKPPRGLILSTGEDVPRRQSLQSRVFIVELPKGAVDWARLTVCQADAAAGRYAQALAAFIRWLAPRYHDLRRNLRSELNVLRDQAWQSSQHRRTPEIVANLALGLRLFLDFAEESGALTAAECAALCHRGWTALGTAAAAQGKFQRASEPTQQFVAYMTAAISSGEAHVASHNGNAPQPSPQAWGWRFADVSAGEWSRHEWRPQGKRIGWLDEAALTLYLEPEASYAAAQAMAAKGGDGISVSSQTLRKRLHDQRLLAHVDATRETLTVRRMLEGKSRNVVAIMASLLEAPPAEEPDKPDMADGAGFSQLPLSGGSS